MLKSLQTLNLVGVAVVSYLLVTLVLLIGGVFWQKLLNGGFLMFIVGFIPCCIGLFFIKFEGGPKR